MKVVAAFSKVEEAYVLRSHLEGSGIAAYVNDEHIVQQDWFLSNAVGGVKVEVAEEDYADAREIYLEVYGGEIAQAKDQNKRKHEFGRYLKIAFVTALVFAIFMVVKTWVPRMGDVPYIISGSAFVGGAFGLMLGLLDL